MSTQPSFDVGGYNLKEWSFLILMFSVAFVLVVIAIAFAIAVGNAPEIAIEGAFDLSQFTTILIAVASIAAVMVAQQLTTRNTANLIKQVKEG